MWLYLNHKPLPFPKHNCWVYPCIKGAKMRLEKGFVHGLIIGISVLICMAGVLGNPSASQAQLSPLHDFSTGGSDGTFPHGSLTLSGSTLYGMTSEGGGANPLAGTIFQITTGGAYQVLYNFSGAAGDGAGPYGSITLSGSTLYGLTSGGGDFDDGTIFQETSPGSVPVILHSFNGSDGAFPNGSLALVGSTLWGMTSSEGGGPLGGGHGTIFQQQTTPGSAPVIWHTFTGFPDDGAAPQGSLTLVGSTLYGMSSLGGPNTTGTIFEINTDGSGYKVLYSFGSIGSGDGNYPDGDLILVGSTLYGMTSQGGANGHGMIFKLAPGSAPVILYSFNGFVNGDGETPTGSLTLSASGSTLYGMTSQGGDGDYGTIFQIDTNGNNYKMLYSFTGQSDGGAPQGSLTLVGSTLYGMTMQYGGIDGAGTIFSLPLTVAPTAPGAPTIGTATAGNGQATVSFTAPDNGGSPITGYTATSSPGGKTGSGAATATSITVGGLTNGTAYTFTVTAANTIGTSLPSASSNAVTPGIVPSAPTNVTAKAGNGQATVSFKLPAKGPITSCTVTSNPGGIAGTGAGSPITVTGLNNGTAYTFTVTATNAIGTSLLSSPSKPVTPVGPPGAPTNVTATAGNAESTVSFSAPASNGSPITSYTVTSSGGQKALGKGTSITLKGLKNGTAYTFTVTATNKAGTSPPSGPSTSVIPATVPGAPTGVKATAGNAEATVSFTAPASNGSPITSYTVTSSPGGLTASGAGTTLTVTELTSGDSYTFTVKAANAIGTGPASKPSNKVKVQ